MCRILGKQNSKLREPAWIAFQRTNTATLSTAQKQTKNTFVNILNASLKSDIFDSQKSKAHSLTNYPHSQNCGTAAQYPSVKSLAESVSKDLYR
ncbi:hypothetical protein CEXT_225301 [Caerostris extrusa]|uniref:Uncharacterized protein n=1 Tax=Caerostris extrusa TaxID=172846 RepID=A0AAV4NBC9_CAEEX|nr:hypothetical protein CEXT_225301 [Caerostris extrusa]